MPDEKTPSSGRPPLVQTAEERYRQFHPEDFQNKPSPKTDSPSVDKHDQKGA